MRTLAYMTAGVAAATALVYYVSVNPLRAPAVCAVVMVASLAAVSIKFLPFTFYGLLAATIIFEQFQIFGLPNILTGQIPLYLNLNLTTGIGFLFINPIELLLVAVLGIWFIRAAASKQWRLRDVPNFYMTAAFIGMLSFYVLYGLARGGDWKIAIWEVRALFYLCLLYLICSQMLHTRRQVQICIWTAIIATSFKGVQGCWRFFVTLGRDISDVRAITGHEDALFFAVIMILLVALFFFDRRRKEFYVLLAFLPTTALTFILTQRRISYGAFVIGMIIVFALLPAAKKILAIKLLLPLVPFMLLYTAAFWNSTSLVAMPIERAKSVFEDDLDGDRSNYYRKVELVNLQITIRNNPLGVGFGNKYEIYVPLDAVDFPLWEYIPHNCLYWIWAKCGFPGFAVFWLFFGLMMTQATIDYRKLKDPYFRSVALMVLVFICSQVIVAYYDLQITFYRNMIYLGIVMALPGVMRKIEQGQSGLQPTETLHGQ